MQTKRQKQEKVLAYWKRELQNNRFVHREPYIKGQIAILERKLTLRAGDVGRQYYRLHEPQPAHKQVNQPLGCSLQNEVK